MSSILNYIINMMPYMIAVIPIFIIVRLVVYKRNNGRKINWHHEVMLLFYVQFIIGLGSQAIKAGGNARINLIPFKVFFDTYKQMGVYGNMHYFLINILGNIIMFMPIGFCVPLLWKVSKRKTILVGFCSSLFIEACQLFLGRCTDVDDLWLNTLGTVLGLLIFQLLYKRFKGKMDKFISV